DRDVPRLALDAPRRQVAGDLAAEGEPAEGVEMTGEGGEVAGDGARERSPHLVHGERVAGHLAAAEVEADGRTPLREGHAAGQLQRARPEREQPRPGEAPPALGRT